MQINCSNFTSKQNILVSFYRCDARISLYQGFDKMYNCILLHSNIHHYMPPQNPIVV